VTEGPEDGLLNADHILAVLAHHQVEFVLVGSYGAIVQGVELPLTDIDIVPDGGQLNLERLVEALKELAATRINAAPGESLIPTFFDDPSAIMKNDVWNLKTPSGKLDLVLHPSGFDSGYDAFIRNARQLQITGSGHAAPITVLVADAYDIYLSKRRAGRGKDHAMLKAFESVVREHYKHQEAPTI